MKKYTYNEIINVLGGNQYATAELLKNKRPASKQPRAGVTPVEWWITEIAKHTQSPTFEPGQYDLQLYFDRQKKKKGDCLPITLNANEIPKMGDNQPIIFQKESTPNVLSYEQAINAVKKISDLEAQVNLLTLSLEAMTKERDELKLELEEVEWIDEDEENKEKLAENAPANTMKQMVETAIPIIDKHYEHADKKLNFDLMKFYQANPHMAPAEIQKKMFPNGLPPAAPQYNQPPPPQQQQGNIEQIAMQKTEAFFQHLAQNNPAIYQSILPVYEQCQNMQQFMASLMQGFPDIYHSLTTFLNS